MGLVGLAWLDQDFDETGLAEVGLAVAGQAGAIPIIVSSDVYDKSKKSITNLIILGDQSFRWLRSPIGSRFLD